LGNVRQIVHEHRNALGFCGLANRSPSVALADRVKSFDWRMRGAAKKGRVTAA
jgi:hypothetical protein